MKFESQQVKRFTKKEKKRKKYWQKSAVKTEEVSGSKEGMSMTNKCFFYTIFPELNFQPRL